MSEEIAKIDQSIQRIRAYDPIIAELKKDCLGLTIKGVEDKEGYELVKVARIGVRDKRISLEVMRKQMVESANTYTKTVNNESRRIREEFEAIEADLQAKQDVIDTAIEAEKERKRQEKQRFITDRINALVAAGMEYDDFMETYIFKDIDGKIIKSNTLATVQVMDDVSFGQIVSCASDLQRVKIEAKTKADAEIKRLKEQEELLKQQQILQDKKEKELKNKELELANRETVISKAEVVVEKQKVQEMEVVIETYGGKKNPELIERPVGYSVASKSDKIKIKVWMDSILATPRPDLSTQESKDLLTTIQLNLENWHKLNMPM